MGFDRGACGRPNRRFKTALIFLALFGALLAVPNALADTTFTVNSTADPGDGVCTVFDCTLREAIDAANIAEGPDEIKFEIAIGGSFTIFPDTQLPNITEDVAIDAR